MKPKPQPKPRFKPRTTLKFRAYDIISRAVDDGIRFGQRRAYKYIEPPNVPDEAAVFEAIYTAIMNELSDVLDYGDE